LQKAEGLFYEVKKAEEKKKQQEETGQIKPLPQPLSEERGE